MTEVLHPHVPGIPEDSRASTEIEARNDGLAEWVATRLQIFPSVLVSWIVANLSALLIASVMISVGLLTTRGLLSFHAFDNADEWLPAWAQDQRTPARNDLSKVGSDLGDAVLIVTAGAVGLWLVLRRRWRMAVFVIQAGLVEALVYLLVSDGVNRARPAVQPLDRLNPAHSFPSGHVGASVAVYGAIALLLTTHFRQFWVRVGIWTVTSGIWLSVATSRIYRGEHHPTDVIAGAIVGFCAVMAALFAARTGEKVAELHATRHLKGGRP